MEVGFPELAIGFEPLIRLGERAGFEAAGTALGIRSARNQASALQDFEMFGDSGLAHGKRLRQFVHGSLAGGQPGQDRATGRVSESGERGVQGIRR